MRLPIGHQPQGSEVVHSLLCNVNQAPIQDSEMGGGQVDLDRNGD